jgi:hypothetical protein
VDVVVGHGEGEATSCINIDCTAGKAQVTFLSGYAGPATLAGR